MNLLGSFIKIYHEDNIKTAERIENCKLSLKSSLAIQVKRVIMLVILFAAMLVVGLDSKVQAEEQSIDATNTTPYSYSMIYRSKAPQPRISSGTRHQYVVYYN